jgi:thermitase
VVSSKALQNAVKYAARKGAVLVASAGNDGEEAVTYPAAFSEVIAVGATDNEDQRAVYSNYGARWVDVAAPGDEIYSTGPNHPNAWALDSYGSLSGTSMAAAFVSGEAALLFARKAILPVRWRIEHNTDRVAGTGKYYKYGRISLQKAVSSL